MSRTHGLPELNYIVFSGTVTQKDSILWSKYNMHVIRFRVENTVSPMDPASDRKRVYELAVEAWGELAEEIDRTVTTGSSVLVEGSLVSRAFVDRKKEEHHRMIVKASSVKILDVRS